MIDIVNLINKMNLELLSVKDKDLIYKLEKLASILNELTSKLDKNDIKQLLEECPSLNIIFNELILKFNDIIDENVEKLFFCSNLINLVNYYSYNENSNLDEIIYKYFFKTKNVIMQKELVKQAKEGDSRSKELLIILNDGIINKFVNRYSVYYSGDREELVEVGKLAILVAINKYDINSKTSFFTYATRYIKGFILNKLSEYNTLNYSQKKLQYMTRIRKVIDEFEKENIEPTIDMIAKRVELSEVKVKELLDYIHYFNMNVSLDESRCINTSKQIEVEPLKNTIIDNKANLSTSFESKELSNIIYQALNNSDLTLKQQEIIIRYFGLATNACGLEDIAKIMNTSRQSIYNQLHVALKKLKIGPFAVSLASYSCDEDFNIRLIFIEKNLTIKIFSNIFPDFYSFFPEYTIDEIIESIKELNEFNKKTLNIILEKANKKEVVLIKQREEFIEVVKNIYLILFKQFGRRELVTLTKEIKILQVV